MSNRGRRALAVLVLTGVAIAWLLLDALPWPARAFTVFLLVPLPALLLAQTRLVHELPEEAERESVYVSSAFSIWILAGVAMLAARFGGITRQDLRLETVGPGVLFGAAGAAVLAGLAVMAAGRLLQLRDTALLDYLIPRTSPEKIAFAGLSVSAGIAEEVVFRSFLIAALLDAGSTLETAAAVSVTAFAVSHSYQGVSGTLRVALLGAILTAPFLLTGSVYPSMLAHAVLDILAGIFLADWLQVPDRH